MPHPNRQLPTVQLDLFRSSSPQGVHRFGLSAKVREKVTGCSASTIFADRIDSRLLLPARDWLPHVNCYPAAAELRGGREDGEAAEYGDTPRA